MTEKSPIVEFVGTLGDLRPRSEADVMCTQKDLGIDPCSSAGLD